MKKDRDSATKTNKYYFFLSIFICILIWIAWPFYLEKVVSCSLEERALYGDSFGGVNALFTALAFATLLISYRQTQIELRAQQEEAHETREVHRETGNSVRVQIENQLISMKARCIELKIELAQSKAENSTSLRKEEREAISVKEGLVKEYNDLIKKAEENLSRVS